MLRPCVRAARRGLALGAPRGKEVQRRLFRTDAIAGWEGWAHVRQGWLVQTVVQHDDGRVEVALERWF